LKWVELKAFINALFSTFEDGDKFLTVQSSSDFQELTE